MMRFPDRLWTELGVMPFWFGLRGSSDRGVLSSGWMLAVIRLTHDQMNG